MKLAKKAFLLASTMTLVASCGTQTSSVRLSGAGASFPAKIYTRWFKDLSNDGVVYAELRFAPLVHTFKGLTTSEIINSVVNGIKDGMEKYDIVAGVIFFIKSI